MVPEGAHKLTLNDNALAQEDDMAARRAVTAPDEAVSRLLDGEAVWVPRTLLPAIQRTLELVATYAKARQIG